MKRAVGVLVAIIVVTEPLPCTALAAEPHYVGAAQCKACHDKKGTVQQFSIWKDSKHAQAYEILGTEQAKKFASEAGLKTDPQQAKECLECHVTGYGGDSVLFAESFHAEDGVQCEACHGPGSDYKKLSVMSVSNYKKQPDVQHELALKAGLVIPDEGTCKSCHNERSPAYKGFDFTAYYEKIKHEYATE